MDNDLITAEVLITRFWFKLTLINTGYEYYFVIIQGLVTESWFQRVKFLLKPIIRFVKENIKKPWVEITEISKFFMDIYGY